MIRANAQPRKGRRRGDAAVELSGTSAFDASAPHPADTAPACCRLAREENAELKFEVGRLEEEVAGLEAENAGLKAELAESEAKSLAKEQKLEAENVGLKAELVKSEAKRLAKDQRIEELERSLGQTSRNSGKPPSSDGLAKPPADQAPKYRFRSLRGKTDRKSGGQPGHQGVTRLRVEKPDRIVNHYPKVCPSCNEKLPPGLESESYTSRQVIVAPARRQRVVEHRVHVCGCPRCGKSAKGRYPKKVAAAVQFHKSVADIVVYHYTCQYGSLERIPQMLNDTFGIEITQATAAKMISEAANRHRPSRDKMLHHVAVKEPVSHHDESGCRVAGKLYWLHTTSSGKLTALRVEASRSHLLPRVVGVMVHDDWGTYRKQGREDGRDGEVRHAQCGAHILRYANSTMDHAIDPYEAFWAGRAHDLLLFANEVAHLARAKGLRLVPKCVRKWIELEYVRIAEEAEEYYEKLSRFEPERKGKRGRPKRRFGHNLARRLLERMDEILLFLHDLSVPFTNNEAERDLRMMKMRMKVSGCFRTKQGADDFAVLRSVANTARKNKLNVMESLSGSSESFLEAVGIEP